MHKMKNFADDDEKTIRKVTVLQDVPARDPEKAAKGKALFLAKAAEHRKHLPERQRKPSFWAGLFSNSPSRKLGALPTILLIIAILFGGSGVSVVAAQSAQPQDILYPVKLTTEDLGYNLKSGPTAIIDYCLELTNRRVEEIITSTESQKALPEITSQRLMAHIDEAVLTSSELSNQEMLEQLVRLQTELMDQLNRMESVQTNDQTRQVIERILIRIQARIRTINNNSKDLEEFRIRINNGSYEAEIEIEGKEIEYKFKQDDDDSGKGNGSNDADDQKDVIESDGPDDSSGKGSGSDDPGSEDSSNDSSGKGSGSGSDDKSGKSDKPDDPDDPDDD